MPEAAILVHQHERNRAASEEPVQLPRLVAGALHDVGCALERLEQLADPSAQSYVV